MPPTDTQLANRLNPTPDNINVPTEGAVFTSNNNFYPTAYTIKNGQVSQLTQNSITANTDLRRNDGTIIKAGTSGKAGDFNNTQPANSNYDGALWSNGYSTPGYTNDQVGSLPNFNLGDIQSYIDKFGKLPPGSGSASATLNNTPNAAATPQQIADNKGVQAEQLAGDQGKNVTVNPDGTVSKNPLGTPAAQTPTSTGSTQTPNTAGAAAGAPINYTKSPLETIDQYNARIAASGGPSAPTGTSTGAAGTIDTNYQMKPGETIDSYNARIAAYNAQKPVTTVSGQPGSSGTMAETQASTGAPDPYAGLDPVAKQVKMYTDAYSALGLNTIKQQFDDYTKQQADLTDEMNQKIQDTQNNPWLSQGVSDRTVQRIKDSYATKLDTLTHLLTLTDSLYKQGQAQVDTMVSAANADIKATNDLAQKQIDAANALAKDNSVHSELVNGVPHDLLINNETGKTVADLGPSASTASSGFSLSAGQTRFDANGNPIASVATKPTSSNTPSPTSTSSNTLANDTQAVLEGRNTMYNIRQTMGRSNSAATYMANLRDAIAKEDPKFDFVASDAGGKSVSTAYVQKATGAINSVIPNIQKVVDLSNQVSRIGVTGVDALLQKGGTIINNQKVSNFHEAQKLIADEIGVALGAGTVSDMKLQLGFDITDPSVSQEVFASNMGLVNQFLQNRLAGLNSLRYSSSTVGGSSGGDTASLAAQYGI